MSEHIIGDQPIIELPAEGEPDEVELGDAHEVLDELTPEEIAEGKRLGETIDTGDDFDNGGIDDEAGDFDGSGPDE